VKIDPVPEGLDGRDDAGCKRAPGHNLEIAGQGPEGRAAEIPQKPTLVLEEDPQHPGDGENDLAVRNIQEKLLPHPLAPFLKALGMTRRAEASGAAGEHQEPLLAAVGTADGGEPAVRITAVKITLHDLLDDRPEEPILLLETALVFCQKPVEVMEQHPIENGPLRMPGTIDSRHGGRRASRNGPSPRIGPRLPEKTGRVPARKAESGRENVNGR